MKRFRSLIFLAVISINTVSSSFAQSTTCQNLESLGQEVSNYAAVLKGQGLSQDEMTQMLKGYTAPRLAAARACSQSSGQPAPSAPPQSTPTPAAAKATALKPKPGAVPTKPADPKPAANTPTNLSQNPPASPVAALPEAPAAAPVPAPPTDAATSPTCNITAVDENQPTPTLNPFLPNDKPTITGQVTPAAGVTVQVCSVDSLTTPASYVSLATATPDANGHFTLPSVALSTGEEVVAQVVTHDRGKTIYGPLSARLALPNSCSQYAAIFPAGNDPALAMDPLNEYPGSAPITGSVVSDTPVQVRVCINDHPVGEPFTTAAAPAATPATGTPTPGAAPAPKSGQVFALKGVNVFVGDVVTAQVVISGDPSKYGKPSPPLIIPGTCADAAQGNGGVRPVVTATKSGGFELVNGTVPDTSVASVRICVGEKPGPTVPAVKGSFAAVIPAQSGVTVTAQAVTSAPGVTPARYGAESAPWTPGYLYSDRMFGSYIAGVEQSGYSSEVTNTNAFISAYIHGAFWSHGKDFGSISDWGRVRLLSAPQPSPPNIVSVVTDPAGGITQTSLSKVGEVIDYSVGGELRLHQRDAFHADFTPSYTSRFSFIGGIGETTPLTANTQLLTFNAPAANTPDCAQLLNLFKTQLFADTDPTQNACIWNPATKTAYQYVAFTSQDRSNFLFKYGGGFRYTQIYAPKTPGTSPYSGMLDITMGQDETVTGGRMHGAVFKVDGQTPFPYGNLSFIYFFGSASIRLVGNQTSAPLVLATPQGGTPTIPNPAVAVLPLQQPNRDFYRFGVGMNLLDIFTKLKGGPSTAPAAVTPAPATTPTNATGSDSASGKKGP